MVGLVLLEKFAATCPDGNPNCLVNIPHVEADQSALSKVLGLTFGVLAAIAVIIIVIQGIKFSTAQGDPQKVADARRSIIYAVVGLVVALSAEAAVQVVLNRL